MARPILLPLIVLTHPFLPNIVREVLSPRARVRVASDKKALFRLLPQADGLVTRLVDQVDKTFLQHAPKLRALGNFAVGTDNIDLKACRAQGIRVVNTPDVLTRATAELTLALCLAAARRFPEGMEMCRKGQFKGWQPDMLLGIELKGRTAVLVGRGRIGQETAKLFEGIGLRVEWITRQTSEPELREKLRRAQILSFHTPLTPETRHWLSAARLKLLPRDAVVLNTTRGPVIDERALTASLKSRKIFAAGLDVFEYEPNISTALRALPNVVMLPHLGSATVQAREAMAKLAFGGVLEILDGQSPINEVTFD